TRAKRDWSSDVCASDLPERRRQSPAAAPGGRTAPSGDAEEPRPGPVTTADGTRRAPGPARIGGRGRARGPAPHRAPSAPAAPQEIGRAAWRERVPKHAT